MTAADKMSKWFYGMEVGQAKASVDLRPGGKYLIEMFNEKGENHRAYGIYLELFDPKNWFLPGRRNALLRRRKSPLSFLSEAEEQSSC